MSKTSITVTSIVIIVLLVIFGGWWYVSNQNASTAPTGQSAPVGYNASSAHTPSSPNTANTAAVISATDTSDAALNSDLSTMNSQINGLASDSESVDQSSSQNTNTQAQ